MLPPKLAVKVREEGWDAWDVRATTRLESTQPLRRAAGGTSLRSRISTDSRVGARNSDAMSSGEPVSLSLNETSQYCSSRTPDPSITMKCPGSSLRISR